MLLGTLTFGSLDFLVLQLSASSLFSAKPQQYKLHA